MRATRSYCGVLCVAAIALGFVVPAYADLFNRGMDTNGNRLIYDSDLNVTWYDFTFTTGYTGLPWQACSNWAGGLSVNLAGNVYDDWRLPAVTIMEAQPPTIYSYDGSTTRGFNNADSDMGHLFYTELGNVARYTTEGMDRGAGDYLVNKGPFLNLSSAYDYYTSTAWYEDWVALSFNFREGISQNKVTDGASGMALAVMDGDVVPEPTGAIFLLASGMLLARGRFAKKA